VSSAPVSRVPFGCSSASVRADYLDRGFTPHLLDISKQGLRAKFMRPVFPVRTPPQPYREMLTFFLDANIPVSSSGSDVFLYL